MQPPARRRPSQSGRGRGPVRWTPWEIALIIVSVLMIAFPLYAEATRLVFAPVAPAQGNTPVSEPATPTNDPVFPPTDVPPTDVPPTDVPPTEAPTDTPVAPSDTPVAPTATGTSIDQGPTPT
ncbi:MAG TPA: hypothetical protein PKD53_26525, partial [Chloroflexaceae bacterium]|nr:hypothetical protein [Chloroflexaceae bacterium]